MEEIACYWSYSMQTYKILIFNKTFLFTDAAFELEYHSRMINIQYLEIFFWIFRRGEFDDEQI